MGAAIDHTGKRYGMWVVVERAGKDRHGHATWLCKCDCGAEKEVLGDNLLRRQSTSCGCDFESRNKGVGSFGVKKSSRRTFRKSKTAMKGHVFGTYRRNARTRGIEFSLSRDYLEELIAKDCHYCGAAPGTHNRCHGHGYTGIDRVSNDKGYYPWNVVPCCKRCNLNKKCRTVEEWRGGADG